MGMLEDGTVVDPCEGFFAIDKFAVLWATSQGTQNITRVAVYFISWKREAGVQRLLVHMQSRRPKQRAIKTRQVKKFVALHSRGVVSDSKFPSSRGVT